MSIQVVCPNGHSLTVGESSAGKIGLCPVCKAPVAVPQADSRQLSEDAASAFPEAAKQEAALATSAGPGVAPSGVGQSSVAGKRCGRCNREILAALTVCPFCHNPLVGS